MATSAVGFIKRCGIIALDRDAVGNNNCAVISVHYNTIPYGVTVLSSSNFETRIDGNPLKGWQETTLLISLPADKLFTFDWLDFVIFNVERLKVGGSHHGSPANLRQSRRKFLTPTTTTPPHHDRNEVRSVCTQPNPIPFRWIFRFWLTMCVYQNSFMLEMSFAIPSTLIYHIRRMSNSLLRIYYYAYIQERRDFVLCILFFCCVNWLPFMGDRNVRRLASHCRRFDISTWSLPSFGVVPGIHQKERFPMAPTIYGNNRNTLFTPPTFLIISQTVDNGRNRAESSMKSFFWRSFLCVITWPSP